MRGRLRTIWASIALASLLLWPLSVSAEPEASQHGGITARLERFRATVGSSVREAAAIVDQFFAEEKLERERNDTSFRIQLDGEFGDGETFEFRARPRLRLRLPATEKTLLLEFEALAGADESDDDVRSPTTGSFDPSLRDEDDEGFTATLRALSARDGFVISPEFGVGVEDQAPNAFVGGFVRQSFDDAHPDWSFLVSERVRAHSDRGLESDTLFRADRSVFDAAIVRTEFEINWDADEAGVRFGPGVGAFYVVEDVSAAAIDFGIGFETHPEHRLDTIVTRFRYRREVFFDWTKVEVRPQFAFREEDGFRLDPSIRVRLEIEFGLPNASRTRQGRGRN